MSFQDTLILVQVIVLLGSTGLNIYLFLRSRTAALWRAIADGDTAVKKAAQELVEGVAGSVDEAEQQIGISRGVERDLDKRLAVLESHIGGIPTHNDLLGIREGLAGLESRLGEKIGALDERSGATHTAVGRLTQFLLERGK